jgi:hypothetical protein
MPDGLAATQNGTRPKTQPQCLFRIFRHEGCAFAAEELLLSNKTRSAIIFLTV